MNKPLEDFIERIATMLFRGKELAVFVKGNHPTQCVNGSTTFKRLDNSPKYKLAGIYNIDSRPSQIALDIQATMEAA